MQGRRREDQPLSEGKQMAKFVNEAIRGATRSGEGRIFDFTAGVRPDVAVNPPGMPAVESSGPVEFNKGQHIQDFTSRLSVEGIKRINRRDATEVVRVMFDNWKTSYVGNMHTTGMSRMEMDGIRGLTLKDAADYAAEQFNRYTKEAIQAEPGSREYHEARAKSDHWSVLDEFLGPAADPDHNY